MKNPEATNHIYKYSNVEMRKTKPKQQSKATGFIRIISGQYRGRKLPVHDIEGLRPTTDRVKETLFNWLMMDIRDAKVMDCFAGAGSLGFEALSRFAAQATFIELDRSAAKQLRANTELLQLENAEIINSDAISQLKDNRSGQQFDVVFVDPPFRKNLLSPCCQLLENQAWLTEQALIYVEFEREARPDFPANWSIVKEKQAGQVTCRLYRRA